MTLVIAVTGKNSIWMSVDRRLSSNSRKPKDDARKLLFLETTDGRAILGYAGLGSTAYGTEPSDWMARVLRGRNLPLEQSLYVLADAVGAKLPQHLLQFSSPLPHYIIIPAFLNGEPRLYSIDLARPHGQIDYWFRYRYVARQLPNGQSIMRTIETAGSGARYLPPDGPWARELLKMVTAQDAGRITPQAVASTFARLNNQVAQADTRVGQRCIVAWRFQKGGGSQALFDGTKEERPTPFLEIPTIATGLDVNAIAQMTVRCVMPSLEDALRLGGIMEVDTETIKAELAKLPEEPDDTLI